jgi:AAA domain, putative AbiEii toxin, Type IV TA system
MLVRGVTEAPDHSLILLDEPEVSLHPGAQRGLTEFIREQAKLRGHQFVMATHAPEIVRDLPDEAIKVFQPHPVDGKIDLVSQTSRPGEAFYRLGVPPTDIRHIYVEDSLAAALVKRAIRLLGEAAYAQTEVKVLPGGANAIQTRLIPAFALSSADCLVFLDGDQYAAPPKPSDEISDAELTDTARVVLAGNPQLSLSGGSGGHSQDEENQQLRIILEWVREHVAYLPGQEPESLLMTLLGETPPHGGAGAVKKEWEARTRTALGKAEYEDVTAADILSEQERALARVESSAEQLIAISDRVRQFLP